MASSKSFLPSMPSAKLIRHLPALCFAIILSVFAPAVYAADLYVLGGGGGGGGAYGEHSIPSGGGGGGGGAGGYIGDADPGGRGGHGGDAGNGSMGNGGAGGVTGGNGASTGDDPGGTGGTGTAGVGGGTAGNNGTAGTAFSTGGAGGNGGNGGGAATTLSGTYDAVVVTGGNGGNSSMQSNAGRGGNGGAAGLTSTNLTAGSLTVTSGTNGSGGFTDGAGGAASFTADTLIAPTINLTKQDGALTFTVTTLDVTGGSTTLNLDGTTSAGVNIGTVVLDGGNTFAVGSSNGGAGTFTNLNVTGTGGTLNAPATQLFANVNLAGGSTLTSVNPLNFSTMRVQGQNAGYAGTLDAAGKSLILDLPGSLAAGQTLLTVTGSADLTGTTLTLDAAGALPLNAGDSIVLLSATSLVPPMLPMTLQTASGYRFELQQSGNQLLAVLLAAPPTAAIPALDARALLLLTLLLGIAGLAARRYRR